ncbi:centromere protein H-like isoform X2 [Pleurodeles waltl]|uniref:centromere protein H-like isoform X2 n=1 Tax=Pleurodeles waltl TaxID=8319 RepID=UPI003709908A
MSSRRGKQTKETRDKLMAPFQKLENASLELMQSTINHPRPSNKEKAGISQTVSEVVGLERQMKQQLIDMATNHGTRSREKENIDSSMNVSLDLLHPELENAVCATKNKELSIYRMQCSYAIQNEIENNTQDSESILEVMNNSIAMCKKVHSVQRNNQLLEDKILEVRRRRIDLKLEQQELLKEVKALEERKQRLGEVKMKTGVLEKENIEENVNRLVVIQEVFQRIILSSKVHWAEDPKIRTHIVNTKEFH